MPDTFQRARSEEQRELRRAAILDTASAMLMDMPVANVTLTELARRVGLAKSNVLRYFESREAVLLDLLASALDEWLLAVNAELDQAVRGHPSLARRAELLVATITGTLAARPVLCDLLSAQASVLEHNVSADIAARYKRDMIDDLGVLATTVRAHVPELAPADSQQLAAAVLLMTGAIWAHANPSAAMREAYRRDPALAALELNFTAALGALLTPLLSGLLARRTPHQAGA
jgi:AcrR family transcriptional regulator